jgi:hypothetical protein
VCAGRRSGPTADGRLGDREPDRSVSAARCKSPPRDPGAAGVGRPSFGHSGGRGRPSPGWACGPRGSRRPPAGIHAGRAARGRPPGGGCGGAFVAREVRVRCRRSSTESGREAPSRGRRGHPPGPIATPPCRTPSVRSARWCPRPGAPRGAWIAAGGRGPRPHCAPRPQLAVDLIPVRGHSLPLNPSRPRLRSGACARTGGTMRAVTTSDRVRRTPGSRVSRTRQSSRRG